MGEVGSSALADRHVRDIRARKQHQAMLYLEPHRKHPPAAAGGIEEI